MFNFDGNPKLSEHHWGKIALIFFNLVVYVAFLGFNALSSVENQKNQLFPKSVGGVSDFINIEITPAGWVFGTVWTTIFVLNGIWVLYSVVNIWRRTDDGSLLYRRINFFPWGLFVVFSFNSIVIIVWLFIYTNLYVEWALLLIVISVISVDVCVLIVARRAHYLNDELTRLRMRFDKFAIRFTLNALGIFATWLSLATNLNFAQFLKFKAGAQDNIPETIALVNILVIAIAYFVFENIIWPRFFLYLVSPWFVVNFALAGSIAKNFAVQSTRNKVLTLLLISVTSLMFIGKFVFIAIYKTVWKHRLIKPSRVQTLEMQSKATNKANENA